MNTNITSDSTETQTKSFFSSYLLKTIMCLILVLGLMTYSTNDFSYSGNMPRMRVKRTASMTLTTAWQTVDFGGSSSLGLNINSFGNDPTTGNPMVYYDQTVSPKVFRFYQQDVNYNVYFSLSTTTSILTVQGLLLYRFVIPNGTAPGVDFIFPNPEDEKFGVVGSLVLLGSVPVPAQLSFPLYVNTALKTNGMYLQVSMSNLLALGATSTVNHVDLNIQATAVQN